MNPKCIFRWEVLRRLGNLAGKSVPSVRRSAVCFVLGVMLTGGVGPAQSAEQVFVGVLAFLDEPEVVAQLNLSTEQREKLETFLETREAEALELALRLKNLSPGERAEKLLPFRRESERRGLALLTAEQQKKLQKIRLERLGLASLGEEDVAPQIGLSESQKAEVAKILREREDRLAVTSKDHVHIVRAETERKLMELLTPEQKARWEALLSGTEPSRTEPGQLASARTEPGVSPPKETPLPSTAESGTGSKTPPSEGVSPGPGGPETAKTEMGKAEPAKTESLPQESAKTATVPSEGVKTETPPSEPSKTETANTELPKPETSPSAVPTPSAPAKAEGTPEKNGEEKKTSNEGRPASLPDDTMKSAPGAPSEKSLPQPFSPLSPPGAFPTSPLGVQTTPAPEAAPLVPLDQVKLRFSFRYQPWKDVLEWFAQQAGLSLIMDDPPKGTFNYTDDKAYTPAEAIDLLNGVLQTKGYVLVRRNRMLMVINLENGIPPLLIDTISVEELDRRGVYEVVSVAFQLQKLMPEEIEGEVQKMIGPQGSVVSLPKSRQLLVTETVGRLRAIRRAIERAEDPEGIHRQTQLRQVALQYASSNQVLPILRQFLDIPPEQAASTDGSIRVIADPSGKALLVSGKEEKITRLMEILKILDIPENAAKSGLDQTPQLEVYSVAPADPNSVLAVIQTLLAGSPDARIALDPKTGNLVALCKPAEHATIRATLEQMQADPRKIEVITLSRVDPQTAVTSLKKLFGIGETPDPNKPQIEADTASKQLLVRATQSQLEQIKLLLEKMGETGEGAVGTTQGSNVRMVPLTGRNAQEALERAIEIWPTMHRNRIRVVRPSAVIPTMRPSSEEETTPRPSSAESSSGTASPSWDTPEAMLEQLFGPLDGSGERPASESSGSGLRTRIIRPPVGPSGGGPTPGGGLPGLPPRPPFSPGQPPFSPSGHPAPSSVPQPEPSRPGVPQPQPGASHPERNPPAPVGEKTAADTPASPACWVRTPVVFGPLFLVSQMSASSEPTAAASTEPTAKAPPPNPVAESAPPPSQEASPQKPEEAGSGSRSENTAPSDQKSQPTETPKEPKKPDPNAEPPVIVVAPGPGGIMIASEDLEALDAFEHLLNTLASNLPESNVTVFYLKHAKAEVVADTLERIFGASSSSGGGPSGGGRGLLGDIAGAALGDAGGGILGTLLGLGGPGGGPPGGLAPTGTIQITPDSRLNALVVQANPKDTEMIEELLKILDQEKGPEPVAVQPKARVIPVFNTAAEDIVDLIKEVYSDRLIGGGGAGQRPPTPQEFIQMLRGGGGGRRGGSTSQADIQQKMALGVDSRNNAIIVVAPDQLFQEVEQLVKQLDAAAAESNQTIRVVNLKNANPSAVQQAISALMGGNVQVGRTGSAARTRQQQPAGAQQQQPGAQFQMPFMMPGGQSFPGFQRFQQGPGQFPFQGSLPFQGGQSGRQGRSSRSGR